MTTDAYTGRVLAVPCRYCIAPIGRPCFQTEGRGPAIDGSIRSAPHPSRVRDAGSTRVAAGMGWVR